MKAREVHEHFKRMGTWVDWNDTCDGIKAGDGETEIKAMAVSWKSTFPQLRKACELGCNFFLTHEATFLKGDRGYEIDVAISEEKEKVEFILNRKMVVYRSHDVWDTFPVYGIKDTWARNLGFTGSVARSSTYYSVYEIEPATVRKLAMKILELMGPLGQKYVGVVGNPEKVISRLSLGTGAATDVLLARSLGGEAATVSDDYLAICRIGSLAIDVDFPLIVVNHAASEEWGVVELAKYCKKTFDIPVHFLPQGCQYETIG
ncbi:MAG: Nif3-like dinuclear metal center hexameric protein [Victivallales bacterium]